MGSGAAEGPGEPVVGANVVRLLQTVPDSRRPFLQVGGSPSDSARLRQTDWLRMACKRSWVRIPIAQTSSDEFFEQLACAVAALASAWGSTGGANPAVGRLPD